MVWPHFKSLKPSLAYAKCTKVEVLIHTLELLGKLRAPPWKRPRKRRGFIKKSSGFFS